MRKYVWDNLSAKKQLALMQRPAQEHTEEIKNICSEILMDIKKNGDKAILKYAKKFDKLKGQDFKIARLKIQNAIDNIDVQLKKAIDTAYKNIYKFHKSQKGPKVQIETSSGIECELRTHAIQKVGLYIPGGSAPLVSTVLMLGVPAKIAGCKRVVLCSPGPINDAILYAASLCDIQEIYALGGAHAIGAMAYGSESIESVDKIFGPGNQFVTCAKKLVSEDINGAAIDMPAGPSEVLVIADENADAKIVASDLLSQAEHGKDSQVILLSNSQALIDNCIKELNLQAKKLPRYEIAKESLKHSHAILCKDLNSCIELSNNYAPEHLIIQCKKAKKLADKCLNCGSIFVGENTPESLGDYACGTNHTLPTYGYAKTYSALGTDDFRRRYTISNASAKGLLNIAKTVQTLAQAEGLFAHENAVNLRVQKHKKQKV